MTKEMELLRKLWHARAVEKQDGDDVFAEFGREIKKMIEQSDAALKGKRRP